MAEPHHRHSLPNRIAHTKARMQMAVALLPTMPYLPWQTMIELLDEIAPTPSTPGPERATAFGVTIASDWQTLIWQVLDDREFLINSVGDNIQRMGAPASRLLPLMQHTLTTQDERVGCWCRGDANGVTAGWSLPTTIALPEIVPLLPNHPTMARLVDCAQTLAIPHGTNITQSYLGTASLTTLQLPLLDCKLVAQFEHARLLLDQVNSAPLSPALQEIILAHTPENTPLALWLEITNHTTQRVGISISDPSPILLHHLHALATSDTVDEQPYALPSKLAAFQGMLGARGIASVHVLQHARGIHNLYTYFPLGFDI